MRTKDDTRRELAGILGYPEYYSLHEEESKFNNSEPIYEYKVYVHDCGWHAGSSWDEAMDKIKAAIKATKEELGL